MHALAITPGHDHPVSLLRDELLIGCLERSLHRDGQDRFCQADFTELQTAGYLRLPLPGVFGGEDGSLAQVVREHRRLAYFAGAAAETVSAHLMWVGMAADRWRHGDRSLEWVLTEAAAGRTFAAAHAEAGHDVPLTTSSTNAHRVQGGYRFTGHKSLSTMGPVWSYLGLHALDDTVPDTPRIVHAFLPRNTEGYLQRTHARHDETLLDGAYVPDRYVVHVSAPARDGHDDFLFTLMAWQLLVHAAVSTGIARRALDLTVEMLRKTRHANTRRPLAEHAGAQQRVADMGLDLEAIEAHVEQLASAWSRGIVHGGRWPMKLLAAKQHAAEGACRVLDAAQELAAGVGYARRTGLEQLLREAKLVRSYPGSALHAREVVGRTLLGVD